MDSYNSIKNELLQINQDVESLLSRAIPLTGASDHPFADWQKTCSNIRKHMSQEVVRVAVVGPIKSGKSTFINSLFKGDYLKRGAGVVTSIVTRVRCGKNLKASLRFKSWDEVNSDMEQALVLFPASNWRKDSSRFELRRKKERMDLQTALDSLGPEHLITNGVRNVNSILLASYLKGYEMVKDMISADTMTHQYENDLFAEHHGFVGNGSLAVYLRDIQLEIDSGSIDSNIELADCQGSDSPNPLHLAMIQEYLLSTHLIIYVISSRTGLREADIKFLSIIKKMGIMDNIIFVINFDFSEHESKEDLFSLIQQVEEELLLIQPAPEIYTLSALFNLFKVQGMNLPQKDKLRLEQWNAEKELVGFSDQETTRFESSFNHKLTEERYSLLLKNHLERLGVISSGMDHWIFVNQNILSKDANSANKIIEKVKDHQGRMNQVRALIKSTLDGSLQKMKQELKGDIDRFFDARTGDLLKDTVQFVRGYNISYHKHEESLKASGFSNTLYLVFQELKQALDTFLAESVNPEVIRFVRGKELWIKGQLDAVADTFDAMIQETIIEYNQALGSFGIDRTPEKQKGVELPDLDMIKNISGLALPPAAITMRYTARMKTEAVMRLGFYSGLKIFKRIFRKPAKSKDEEEMLALKDVVLRMKRETEKSIVFHFKDYQENIKFQYIFKLVEAVSSSFYQVLTDRFQSYVADLKSIINRVGDKQIAKEQVLEILQEMELTSREINKRIKVIREKIESSA
jgi:GTPase SAR1 family protein